MPQPRIRRYMRHGTLPQLAVFEASARHGCFTRAGEELHLAQPTVSAQLRKLAETLGTPLFETVGRTVRLTEAGHRTYAHCREMFRLLARLDDALRELREVEGSELRIAVAGAATRHAARLLASFAQEHESVTVRLSVVNRAALLARLAQRHDDLYLLSDAPDDLALVRQRVASSALVVAAPPGHPLAGRRSIAVEALSSERWIVREVGSGTRARLLDTLALAGITPPIALEASSEEAIVSAVAAGAGLALVDRDVAQASGAQVAILDVRGFPLQRTWHLAYPVGASPSPAAHALLRHVRDLTPARQRSGAQNAVGSAVSP